MSYVELTEFSSGLTVIESIKFDDLHIVFSYDNKLSVRGTAIGKRKTFPGNSLYLSINQNVLYTRLCSLRR